jgi:hypothetical protein
MSAYANADGEPESQFERDARRLERYLRDRAAEEGEFYSKSKFMSDDVDMSASQIGNLMPEMAEREGLVVERWAYTNATTWRVALDGDGDSSGGESDSSRNGADATGTTEGAAEANTDRSRGATTVPGDD